MNISDRSIVIRDDNPYATPDRTPSSGQGRRARTFSDEAAEQQKRSAPAESIDPSREKLQAVVPVGEVYSSGRRTEYYQTEDVSRFTSTQRRALQTYSANQGLSMLDANADYLGAVDTFA